MQAQGWGRVLAITSVSVRQPIPTLILSNTARAGVTGFLKTLAREVAADGVTVNSHPARISRHRADPRALPEWVEAVAPVERRRPDRRSGRLREDRGLPVLGAGEVPHRVPGVHVDGGAYAGLQ